MISLKKNEIYSVTIEDLSSEANGVCHINGCAVFVPRALPGEEWEIKIVKAASDRAYARAERLIKVAPGRVEPACPYYGKCGG